jgi:potassium-dependent mechanosensitive channel
MRWPRWARVLVIASVFLAVVAPGGATAQSPTPPAATGPAPTGPTDASQARPIPVPQIASEAENTMARLRAIDAAAQPVRPITTIEHRLSDLEKSVASGTEETYRVLRESPSLAALDELLEPWDNARDQAKGWLAVVTRRAEDLEGLLKRLDELRAHWRLTQASLVGAPEATAERIQDTLAVIDSVKASVDQRRAEVLVVQDRVAQVLARSEEMLDQVQATRRSLLGQLFVRDGLPIWGFVIQSAAWERARELAGHSISAEVPITRLFIREHATSMIAEIALFLALGLCFRHMGRQARRWTSLDDSLVARFRPLDHPFAASALLTLIIAGWTTPPEPRAVRAVAALLALIPIMRLIAGLTSRPLVPVVYFVGGFHAVDLVRLLLTSVPLLEQAIFLVELVALVLALVWLRRHIVRDELTEAAKQRGDRIGRGALTMAIAALIAASLGWVRLARLIEFVLISAAQWALILWALVRLSDALIGWVLRVRPLRQLRAVQEHREAVEHRLQGILRMVAVLFWGVGLASALSILGPATQRIVSILDTRIGWRAVGVTLGDVLACTIVVWLTFLVTQALSAILEEDVFPRLTLRRGIAAALSSLVHYAVLLVGFLLGIGALGIDLTRITILAGALGVGVGFGLQNVVNNFVSGLILLFERPIQVGDSVQLGTLVGEVKRIGIRSSTVRTFEGAEVIVPNASLVSDQVTNWTLSDRMRRIDLDVGVGYGADPNRVVEILSEVARSNPGILPEPAPVVLFLGFGDSALNFQVRAWTAHFEEWVRTRSEVGLAVHAALKQAGIEIPFPQRDVRVVLEKAPDEAGRDGAAPRG